MPPRYPGVCVCVSQLGLLEQSPAAVKNKAMENQGPKEIHTSESEEFYFKSVELKKKCDDIVWIFAFYINLALS